MSLKSYKGSCHCGAVRYEADLDLAAGSNRCNCSLCFKARAWFAFAKGEDRFRLLSGADALSEYRWKPPRSEAPFLTYSFCRHCGIRTFCRAPMPDGVAHAIPVTTLDDVSPEELAASPIQFVDGRQDHFDRAPDDLRLL